jgi:hypothetical protein
MAFKKTTADVPPVAALEFAKAPRPEAVAEADGAGYAKTKPLQKAQQSGQRSRQFGLPKSSGMKAMKLKGL